MAHLLQHLGKRWQAPSWVGQGGGQKGGHTVEAEATATGWTEGMRGEIPEGGRAGGRGGNGGKSGTGKATSWFWTQ